MAKRRLRGSTGVPFSPASVVHSWVSTRNATYRSRAGATRGNEIPLDGGSRVPDPQIYGSNVFDSTSVCLDRVWYPSTTRPLHSSLVSPNPSRMKRTVKPKDVPSFSPQLYPLEQVGGEIELLDADLLCRSSSEQKFGCTTSKARPGV